ncbi:MAG: FliM/FliN family flagellar motor C-terminal domain-containing protein [Acidobacteriota bacterium]
MARIVVTDKEVEVVALEHAKEMAGFFDVKYEVDLRLGYKTITVEELLRLAPGDVIALDRPSSRNVIVAVGDVAIGEAEVILHNSGPAARLVEIG